MDRSTQLLLDDTARRVTEDDLELVVPSAALRGGDVPGRGRGRCCLPSSRLSPVSPWVAQAARCGCGRFRNGWRSR